MIKVRQFQNEFMKSSFLSKYEQKIVRISALCSEGRNPDNFLFTFWEKWWLNKFILQFTDLYLVRQQFKKCICIILYFFSLFKSRNRKVLVRNSKLQCLDYAMVHLAIRFLFIFIFVEIAWCWHTIFKTNFLESRYLAVYGKKEKKSLRVIFIFIANYRLFNLWNW